jgi:hypothetical protein
MKKINSMQMEGLQGGKCWEFNVTVFEYHIVSHYCKGQSTKAPSHWRWF